jgi:hypothetical protein
MAKTTSTTIVTVTAIALGLSLVALLLAVTFRPFAAKRCPSCGGELQAVDDIGAGKTHYQCPKCVLWLDGPLRTEVSLPDAIQSLLE